MRAERGGAVAAGGARLTVWKASRSRAKSSVRTAVVVVTLRLGFPQECGGAEGASGANLRDQHSVVARAVVVDRRSRHVDAAAVADVQTDVFALPQISWPAARDSYRIVLTTASSCAASKWLKRKWRCRALRTPQRRLALRRRQHAVVGCRSSNPRLASGGGAAGDDGGLEPEALGGLTGGAAAASRSNKRGRLALAAAGAAALRRRPGCDPRPTRRSPRRSASQTTWRASFIGARLSADHPAAAPSPLEDLDGLGVVTLPCNHKVCIGCMGELIASNPTFESQQPHNRGKVLPAPWAGMCPMRCATFSQREMRRQLCSS